MCALHDDRRNPRNESRTEEAVLFIIHLLNRLLQQIHHIMQYSQNNWVSVTTAWLVLRLWMEDRPQIWSVAAIIWNKESRTADKGWSSSLGVG